MSQYKAEQVLADARAVRGAGYHLIADELEAYAFLLRQHEAVKAGVTDYSPTNEDVHAWRDRNDLDMLRLEDCRIAIDDARSMHMLAAAPKPEAEG